MDDRQIQLLQRMANGQWVSGSGLARELGMSRAAIWKRLQMLEGLGLRVHALRGRGYRLAQPLELLSELAFSPDLSDMAARLPRFLLMSTESTNQFLLDREDPQGICLAEHQTAGRGRRGRAWHSPFGRNIYLSIAWTYAGWPPELPALGLAMGIAVASSLREAGFEVGLKWPNDLYLGGGKLGGMLIEQKGEATGACRLVAGLGLNWAMPDDVELDQRWASLKAAPGRLPARNAVAARLINAMVTTLAELESCGLAARLAQFDALHVFHGLPVQVSDGQTRHQGVAQGIDEFGRLCLQTETGEMRLAVGDLSLRGA